MSLHTLLLAFLGPGREWYPLRFWPPMSRGTLVFSVRTWEGEYASKDIPGGVWTTPTQSALYTRSRLAKSRNAG